MFDVETLTSLPDSQRDGRDLAGQGQASHLGLHPFAQQTSIEILKRSGITAGPGSRTFEDILQIMIVVAVEATNLNRFLAPL